ncbi:katanin p60 ATPase-containing subunit A-like 2 isoform X1 [Girardinichthys multiradiatus]|uniref:katanin p60 ATPase-containing subunit A-like 2 isoform X1 n=1 Tax=Girardinichthys multiradiatus TaxID=208333 RepID=UPI001FADE857|nr:katanin p60 ATPase-containing subunit A-like 2 isoform X1 [Girardinichthys multiradiatus]
MTSAQLGTTTVSDNEQHCLFLAVFRIKMELSYQSMKFAHEAREADKLRTEMRKKSILVLIYQHLLGQGYASAAVTLDQETNGGVRKFEVCDNVDLEMVLMEYENYHYVKFQRYPKLIRKTTEPGESRQAKSAVVKKVPHSALKPLPKITPSSSPQTGNLAKKTTANSHENSFSVAPESLDLGFNTFSIKHGPPGEAASSRKMTDGRTIHDAFNGSAVHSDHMERLLKPLSGFSGISGEMRELAAIISEDIYLHNPNVRWEDIIGLEDAKRLVKEAVVYPIKYPQLFTGILSPWKGLLLYGPPGTGKTMLAKAVATECKTTFFNISASSIVSKWRGDSEKLVRVLFELARYHAPSTIFLDELESVMGQRGTSSGTEHEGSRRMKTELLIQMDGLATSEDLVFVLAASNLPWELDHGMLRRLEKRILVNLPSSPARQAMISHWLPPISSLGGVKLQTTLNYKRLAEEMEGYSGSDIRLTCKEAAMRPVRKIFDALELHHDADTNMPVIELGTVTTSDFMEVLAHTKPSAQNLMGRYTAWEKKHKSV